MALNDPSPKVILFDLDGTLLLLSETPETCWREAWREVGPDVQAMPLEKVLAGILDQAQWFWSDPVRHKRGRLDLRKARREIVVAAFQKLGLDDPTLAQRIADTASARREACIELAPAAGETLTALRHAGFRLGLITNGDSKGQRHKINTFGLAPFFEVIQIEGEVGIGKPEDGVYEMTLEKLRVEPRDACMVGDDLVWDIQAAQKAGLQAVWVDYERKGLPEASNFRPDRIISCLKELVSS